MSRIPPALLYLTIYNPTLRPTGENSEEDEDAQEQAHVLFYTARERAVSRDKILRQVGLAKALINFSGMFNPSVACENVHSQSRRMVMLSPEPNFWIHGCVELAKTPRHMTPKKPAAKSKGKEPAAQAEAVYDYHDGSVRDLALRTHMHRGYELFRLTHGSFTSILSSLGQQALELQLERFFTVWAWKWDTEEDTNFSTHLGVSLHPLYRTLTPILDDFASELAYKPTTFLYNASHAVPSTKLSGCSYAGSLIGHIASRIPPPPAPVALSEASSTTTVVPPDTTKRPLLTTSDGVLKASDKPPDHSKTTFMPHMNMDMRSMKWGWPGYLTFGKTKSGSPSIPATPVDLEVENSKPLQASREEENGDEARSKDREHIAAVPSMSVDTESLQDAISTENAHSTRPSSPTQSHISPSPVSGVLSLHQEGDRLSTPPMLDEEKLSGHSRHQLDSPPRHLHDAPPNLEEKPQDESTAVDAPFSARVNEQDDVRDSTRTPPPLEIPPPQFLPTTIYLADDETSTITRKMRVWQATRGITTFALIVDYDHAQENLPPGADVSNLFRDIEQAIESCESKTLEASIPSVTKILEPKDKHVVSTGQYTVSSSSEFSSRSEHHYNGQQILRSEVDAQEVFSRGQNPQHWFISKKGLGNDGMGATVPGEVYMEIARKESTLTDVDNALAGIVRRFGELI